MDENLRYLFDLNGYVVIEDVLSPEEVAACNEAIDQNRERIRIRTGEQLLSGGSTVLRGEQGRGDLGGMLAWPRPWCDPFRRLLAHPVALSFLLEILGEGFRLDHLYGIVMTPGTEGHVLHGGGHSNDITHGYRFHGGQIRCGLTVVSWQLADADEGDGGFACIPGSHKANFPPPPGVALLERDLGCVRQVVAKAGSCVIFSEALTHGTFPWRAAHERRSILYKYSPRSVAYSGRYLPDVLADRLDELTPLQRALLEPPSHPNRPRIGELLAADQSDPK
jgi:ectoine hydroxylase-related dioxygenase (phytanoyl-CoA dioxygenase family)